MEEGCLFFILTIKTLYSLFREGILTIGDIIIRPSSKFGKFTVVKFIVNDEGIPEMKCTSFFPKGQLPDTLIPQRFGNN